MRVPGTLLVVLLASGARAESPPAPPPDAIAAARRDLEAIKAPPETATLPAMDMKDLGPVPGGPRPEPPPAAVPERPSDADRKKTGTGNWLVDAMDRNTAIQAGRSKEKDDVLRGDPDLVRADEKGVRLERDPLAPDDARERLQAPADAVYNPLDAFMGGWISARDHDLLLSRAAGDGLPGAAGDRARADLLPGFEAEPSGPAAAFTLAPVDASAFGNARPGANPYLAVADLLPAARSGSFVEPELPALAPAELRDAARGMSASGLEGGPADPARTVIPEFALPGDDGKYFPQLKKF